MGFKVLAVKHPSIRIIIISYLWYYLTLFSVSSWYISFLQAFCTILGWKVNWRSYCFQVGSKVEWWIYHRFWLCDVPWIVFDKVPVGGVPGVISWMFLNFWAGQTRRTWFLEQKTESTCMRDFDLNMSHFILDLLNLFSRRLRSGKPYFKKLPYGTMLLIWRQGVLSFLFKLDINNIPISIF